MYVNIKNRRIISIVLFILGVVVLIGTQPKITGAFIGVSGSLLAIRYILGMFLVLLSIFFSVHTDNLEGKLKGYYSKRVKEIFDEKYNGQDIWVSRWELDGIMDYINNERDHNNQPKYRKPDFEHGKNLPGIHPIGKHRLPHMHISVKNKHNHTVKRHLLITNNPYDSRLGIVGYKSVSTQKNIHKNEPEKSKYYRPDHPRTKDRRIVEKGTNITFERRRRVKS
ncbi:hypothetical protein CL622_07230 [archaeon]|nr:hypothetical protein [archaeon]|tara:strand:- start:1416 stop:2087 length:672 start_codon:yes stop_codon:yes gene_type:complete